MASKTRTNKQAARPGALATAAEAFASLAPEYAKLDPSELVAVNVDVPRAISIVVGAAGRVNELVPAMEAALKNPPSEAVSKLEAYALGLWYAHLLTAPKPTGNDRAQLLERATHLRARLLKAADALADAGLLDPLAVEAIRKGAGNLDKANDLVALTALFFQSWGTIENKTAITRAQLEEAESLGPALLIALSDHGPEKPDAALEMRQRAFTLLARAYGEVRRVVSFLRWHEDDADAYTPSIYSKPRGRRRASDVASESSTEPSSDGADDPSDDAAEGAGD